MGLWKNLLKEAKLLDVNLWAPSDCKEEGWLKLIEKVKLNWMVVKNSKTRTDAYETGVICPKWCRRVCDRYPLGDTSSRHLLRRNNGSSNPYLSLGFHIWLSTTDFWVQNYTPPSICQSHPDGSSEWIPSPSDSWHCQSWHYTGPPSLWRPSMRSETLDWQIDLNTWEAHGGGSSMGT